MKVLILTNPNYHDFIMSQVHSKGIAVYYGEEEYIFHGTEDYDIGISFMYPYKVPAGEVNSHTWYNFHPGPLPEYKGRDLCYHAIMNGEKEFGATLHYMDENFDTGDIIDVRRFPIYDYYTSEDVSRMSIIISEALFMTYYPRILADVQGFERIPNHGGTYYKKGKIIDTVPVKPDEPFGQFIRAVTYKDFYPKLEIGGVIYKVVKE